VNYLPQILDSLPPPYTQAGDSVLASIVNLAALEFEAFQEDLDRMRQTHWIQTAYSLKGAAKLGALLNIAPFPWESLELYRRRLLALVVARLQGALGPHEVRQFAYDYLQRRAIARVEPVSQQQFDRPRHFRQQCVRFHLGGATRAQVNLQVAICRQDRRHRILVLLVDRRD